MKHLLLLLCTATLLLSCRKDLEELPPATETGANTFGAKINGTLWGPMKFGIAPTAPILEARFIGTGGVLITARNFSKSPTESEMEIYIKDISGPGTFALNTATEKQPYQSASYGYYIERRLMPLNEWITNAAFTGSVTITRYDIDNGIVSGSFAFSAKSIDDTADPIQVTEGRFDIKIQ